MTPQSAAQAYARVGVETGVESAGPHRLVLMLYDGALACLTEARGHIARKDSAAKARALSRALQIVDEGLAASLDLRAGGDLARQLKELYAWIAQRVTLANARNDAALIDEAVQLLGELRGAWQTIGKP